MKANSFFKGILVWAASHKKLLLTIAVALVVAFGALQSCRASKWHREHLRLEGKLEEQQADQEELWDEAMKERIRRRAEEAEERAWREELEARIRKVKREGEKAKRELEKEKQKTAKLEPTELVAQIVERIGFESDLTKAGLYLFTRKGAERTLDRFKDGEFYLSEYTKVQKALKDHDLEVASFNESLSECEEEKEGNFKGWEDCRETLETALDDIDALKKVERSVIWKGRVQGAIGGSVVTVVFCKIFGIF